MISREPTIERLAIAKSLLLTPFGLDESHLTRALGEIKSHHVDEADLYFQYTRSEGWSLEEGIVKTGSFSIDQGVGVRAVSGEKTAFAYSDDISEAALLDAARTVRTIGSASQKGRVQVAKPKVASSRSLYSGTDPISSAPPEAPSPMIMMMIGVFNCDIRRRLRAIASACPRSSASRPGNAPGVSRRQITGRLNFSAIWNKRYALR